MKRGVLVVCLLLASASPAQAANCSSCTWSGGGADANWSTGGNWSGGNPPASPVTSLSFPSGASSFTSNNDIGGIATGSLTIDDGSPYTISGSGIVIGSSGLTAATGSLTPVQPTISTPVSLSAAQTWSIDGGGSGTAGLKVTQSVTDASPMALALNLTNHATLSLSNGADVGPITVTGSGAPAVLLGSGASLNGAIGSTVNFGSGSSLVAAGGGTVGPLTLSSASLQIGGPSGAAQLSVFNGGPTSFDSGSAISLFVSQPGTLAGTDYSQYRSAGTIALGGATLSLKGPSPCPTLHVGDVASVVATTGTLTGTFSNAPNGSNFQLTCSGGTPATFQINYTSGAVTATVVSGTSTALTVSPASPVTNQPVMLTAKVTAAYGSAAPAGTVAFDDGGTALPGCAAVPVDSSGTATCQPSFAATSSPRSLTASFTPSSGSGFGASATSSPTSLSVGKASTSTALSVSSRAPSTGHDDTYTAVVTPAYAGETLVTDAVTFLDNGAPITDCSNETQSTDTTSLTVTCTVSYSSTGSHSISASFAGDANFTSSGSSAQTVNVSQSGNGNGNGGGNGSGKLLLSAGTLKVKAGSVSIPLKCSSQKTCSGGFVIKAKHSGKKPKMVVCAAGGYRIAAGKTKQVTAKVSATCLSGLKHARNHRIQARFSSKPKSGQAGVSKIVELTL